MWLIKELLDTGNKLIELKEVNKSTITFGDFHTPFSVIERTSRKNQ